MKAESDIKKGGDRSVNLNAVSSMALSAMVPLKTLREAVEMREKKERRTSRIEDALMNSLQELGRTLNDIEPIDVVEELLGMIQSGTARETILAGRVSGPRPLKAEDLKPVKGA